MDWAFRVVFVEMAVLCGHGKPVSNMYWDFQARVVEVLCLPGMGGPESSGMSGPSMACSPRLFADGGLGTPCAVVLCWVFSPVLVEVLFFLWAWEAQSHSTCTGSSALCSWRWLVLRAWEAQFIKHVLGLRPGARGGGLSLGHGGALHGGAQTWRSSSWTSRWAELRPPPLRRGS
ncbi:unnamed protein product [Prorocentrum cordatum]|nr:unnamed protein product [Polarella glacialis]